MGGALWWQDLLQLAEEVGFSTPQLVTASVIAVNNKELEALLGELNQRSLKTTMPILFSSFTVTNQHE